MKLLGHESMVTSQRYVTAAGTETRTAAAQNKLYGLLRARTLTVATSMAASAVTMVPVSQSTPLRLSMFGATNIIRRYNGA